MDYRVLSVFVAVSAARADDFSRRIENLPVWAQGLASGVYQSEGQWFADSPMGRVAVTMAPLNPHGVLDHDVRLPDGTTVHNAFRVSPAGDGCVFTFVALRWAGIGDQAFEADAAAVRRDLHALKRLLEDMPPAGA